MASGQWKVIGAVLATAAVVMTGCGTGATNPAGSGASGSDDVRPVPGCWVPGSGLAACGDLLSVSGLGPDGVIVDLTRVYRLSAPNLTDDGLIQLAFGPNASGDCAAVEFSVPVRVQGNDWLPDDSRVFTPLVGCPVTSPAHPTGTPRPDDGWIRAMFIAPMLVTLPDAETVRVGSADAGNPVYVDFRWARYR